MRPVLRATAGRTSGVSNSQEKCAASSVTASAAIQKKPDQNQDQIIRNATSLNAAIRLSRTRNEPGRNQRRTKLRNDPRGKLRTNLRRSRPTRNLPRTNLRKLSLSGPKRAAG